MNIKLTSTQAQAVINALDELWDFRAKQLENEGKDQDADTNSPDDEALLEVYKILTK